MTDSITADVIGQLRATAVAFKSSPILLRLRDALETDYKRTSTFGTACNAYWSAVSASRQIIIP
jgi:hypothetical protein